MNIRFSNRALRLKKSAIRNKLFDNPEIITFAAGKPEQSIFPIDKLLPLAEQIIKENGKNAFQYSSSEGLPKLRELIVSQRMKACHVDTTADNIALTSGSQEGIEIAAKIFVNEGDTIICERPSYTGAFGAFAPYDPKYVTIPMDENGMKMDDLENALKENKNVKMIYTIPDSQNPTGITMSDERRQRLAELAAQYCVPVIEDSPYGDLIYEGERHPAVKSFDKEGWVIMLGSFSKTFCPGLRLGWVCADESILEKFVLAKQSSSLQCGTFDQYLAAAFLTQNSLEDHIDEIRNIYRVRRDTTLECIKEYFPKEIKYTKPSGGFFVWLELKEDIDTAELVLEAAKDSKVVFIPGKYFFAHEDYDNFLRLSYSFVNEEQIREGLRRLGELLHKKY